jgi:hypothetical protein
VENLSQRGVEFKFCIYVAIGKVQNTAFIICKKGFLDFGLTNFIELDDGQSPKKSFSQKNVPSSEPFRLHLGRLFFQHHPTMICTPKYKINGG